MKQIEVVLAPSFSPLTYRSSLLALGIVRASSALLSLNRSLINALATICQR